MLIRSKLKGIAIIVFCIITQNYVFAEVEDDAINDIYKNRESLAVKITQSKDEYCKKTYLQYLSQPYRKWQKEAAKITIKVIKNANEFANQPRDELLQDSVLIKIIIKALVCAPNSKENNTEETAWEVLDYNVSFKDLKKYSKEIKEKLIYSKIPDEKKILLASSLDWEKNELDSFLAKVTISDLPVLKYSNDSIKQEALNKYSSTTSYNEKRKYINLIIRSEDEKLIGKFLESYNDTIYNRWGSCIEESIRFPILLKLLQLYPDEELFKVQLTYFLGSHSFDGRENAEVIKFIDDVEKWICQKFQIKIKQPSPTPIIVGKCLRL